MEKSHIVNSSRVDYLLREISRSIIESKVFGLGLNNGEAGKILFMSYLYEHSGHIELLDFIVKRSYGIIEKIQSGKKLNLSLSNGVVGILYVFKELVRKGYLPKEKFSDMNTDRYIYNAMITQCLHKKYDFLSGALGIALYFLNSKAYDKVDYFLKQITSNFEWDNKNRAFFINEKYNNRDVINLGLAHGLAGNLAFYSLAKKENMLFSKYYDISLGLANYLLSMESNGRNSRFPAMTFHKGNNKSTNSRLSWCYGDLCIGLSLLLFSNAFENRKYYDIAIGILLDTIKRTNLIEEDIRDACLCHGTSGLAYMYQKIYQMTSIEEFNNASEYWYFETNKMSYDKVDTAGFNFYIQEEEKEYISPYGFLNGISGVGLSIISGKANTNSSWDRLLLLS